MAYTTIDAPEADFQLVGYTGTGSSQAVSLPGDTNLSPDLVIIKGRVATSTTSWFDTVRGATKQIATSRIGGNAQGTVAESLKSFDSDGFTVGTDGDVNYDGDTYMGHCLKESADSGFDIVSYTGTGSAHTISHSLSAVPDWYAVKELDNSGSWYTFTQTTGNEQSMFLNGTNIVADASSGYWNSTSPTSSVFSVGTNGGINQSSTGYIAYLFRSIQGFSKFGTYTGNNNADGAFVWTGFRPAFVVVKAYTTNTEGWMMFDKVRNPHNIVDKYYTMEGTGGDSTRDTIDFLSNGFKPRIANTDCNNDDYIYMAFADQPFVNSNGVPNNAR